MPKLRSAGSGGRNDSAPSRAPMLPPGGRSGGPSPFVGPTEFLLQTGHSGRPPASRTQHTSTQPELPLSRGAVSPLPPCRTPTHLRTPASERPTREARLTPPPHQAAPRLGRDKGSPPLFLRPRTTAAADPRYLRPLEGGLLSLTTDPLPPQLPRGVTGRRCPVIFRLLLLPPSTPNLPPPPSPPPLPLGPQSVGVPLHFLRDDRDPPPLPPSPAGGDDHNTPRLPQRNMSLSSQPPAPAHAREGPLPPPPNERPPALGRNPSSSRTGPLPPPPPSGRGVGGGSVRSSPAPSPIGRPSPGPGGRPPLPPDRPGAGGALPPTPPMGNGYHNQIQDEWESRFNFHPVSDLPPPQPYVHFQKTYPSKIGKSDSRGSGKKERGAPPLPPIPR
ncbi:hypothetical protein CesoFtcFv8_021324 [Champsocephalus esox]|uniref:WAS/WASL interacting protein family member 1 n=1 Tax=Champsocephalus esox TaxID=159716 RepID=A0AAN8GMQ7_9TELE|nr:hypothetical protein CesoFtcFv8_021324 [Champsocephalus esox]